MRLGDQGKKEGRTACGRNGNSIVLGNAQGRKGKGGFRSLGNQGEKKDVMVGKARLAERRSTGVPLTG